MEEYYGYTLERNHKNTNTVAKATREGQLAMLTVTVYCYMSLIKMSHTKENTCRGEGGFCRQ